MKKNKLGLTSILIGTLLSAPQLAYSDVLYEPLPSGISEAETMNAVAAALMHRKWQVGAIERRTVFATISHNGYECDIKISAEENALSSSGKCLTYWEAMDDFDYEPEESKNSIPKRWLNYIRSDIDTEFQKLALRNAKQSAKPESALERLTELQKLKDAGLITDDEFTEKRQQIIDGI